MARALDHDLDLDAVRREASGSDDDILPVTRGWVKQVARELDRIPALQAQLAGLQTVDIVVQGMIR